MAISDFIARWRVSGGSEQANSQLFLSEFCDALKLPRPDPARPVNEENIYSFERKVYIPDSNGAKRIQRLDLYRKGCFVLEAKQGQGKSPAALPGLTVSSAFRRGTPQWEDSMQKAKRQAEQYIRSLPAGEGRPPFLIVADIGYCFDLYTEFSRSGGQYLHYPEARHYRIMLDDLELPETQNLFRSIWNDPDSLDPARRSAAVTEEVAGHLAGLARLLEADGYSPERVSSFLMRCIFSMFAEDTGLLPDRSFTNILERALTEQEIFAPLVRDLWQAMNDGSFSVYLCKKLLRFNGRLFANPEILPLDKRQIGILLEAARADWHEVEPAIFGTLLERALDPQERHKLGAHYTPRSYVERIVIPTIMQPLRKEWEAAQAAAALLHGQSKDREAIRVIEDFHKRLLKLRVLDPACGSGNFLYVSMEHLKRLEAEVCRTLIAYGGRGALQQIDPHQFLGIELNPRAATIAEMVLWIGYLQWHYRSHGNVAPPEPIIKKCNNIENRDALLAYKKEMPAKDSEGRIITHWDGMTFKTDPVTGRQIPDETSRKVEYVYENVTEAQWPDADFIVGNPPFIGSFLKRSALGTGYFNALINQYKELPESCDFVMYWWNKAASLAKQGKINRFGFISTNSITQIFNRRVISSFLDSDPPLQIIYAIPDHPWVNAADGATVRIAMTVAGQSTEAGTLETVVNEQTSGKREYLVDLQSQTGKINPDLTIGTDITKVEVLQANTKICARGVSLHGSGFIISPEEAIKLGLGSIKGIENHIKRYRNGKDLSGTCRNAMVIDLFGLKDTEVLKLYPAIYQWVYERVKPERDVNRRQGRRLNWWIFGEPLSTFRPALSGLPRYIACPQTSKHLFFTFLDGDILPDYAVVNIAVSEAFFLGVLSSHIHLCWALAAGGTLGTGPRYNNTVCFSPFPFPDPPAELRRQIAAIAENLDKHRKEHNSVTITEMYNVLQALRSGRELSKKEKEINEKALVTVLGELHYQLDAAVAKAYGWPVHLPDQEILTRLVALNQERREEEKQGKIRWLRPEYQKKGTEKRGSLAKNAPKVKSHLKEAKRPWPAVLKDQIQAVRDVLHVLALRNITATPENAAKMFTPAKRKQIAEIMDVLNAQGLT